MCSPRTQFNVLIGLGDEAGSRPIVRYSPAGDQFLARLGASAAENPG